MVVNGLEKRYQECVKEKNGTLIRYDILVDLKNLYEATTANEIKEKALELIELEKDLKYKKKYGFLFRNFSVKYLSQDVKSMTDEQIQEEILG